MKKAIKEVPHIKMTKIDPEEYRRIQKQGIEDLFESIKNWKCIPDTPTKTPNEKSDS